MDFLNAGVPEGWEEDEGVDLAIVERLLTPSPTPTGPNMETRWTLFTGENVPTVSGVSWMLEALTGKERAARPPHGPPFPYAFNGTPVKPQG